MVAKIIRATPLVCRHQAVLYEYPNSDVRFTRFVQTDDVVIPIGDPLLVNGREWLPVVYMGRPGYMYASELTIR